MSDQQDLPPLPLPDGEEVVETKIVKKKSMEVVATRPGFYKQRRIAVGQVFTIASEKELGSWMKLVDPVAEKKRQAEEKKKKAGA